jgi:hypothetical protein
MNPFWIGIIGSLVLVSGAAYPVRTFKKPYHSTKNWLYAIGGAIMLSYSILNYLNGGPIFFVFLQTLVNIASILMMLNTDDRIDTGIITVAGLGLIIWSLTIFEDFSTFIFIFGLVGIAIGYAMNTGSFRRNLALTIGSLLIATFSYMASDWIFFWLNVFFAMFSGYYSIKIRMNQ